MISKIAVVLFFLIEFLLLTYYNEHFGALKSPLILFFSSLGIGIVGISSSTRYQIDELDKLRFNFTPNLVISAILPLTWILILFAKLSPIFESFPINFLDVSESDVIPQIGYMVKRLFEGEFPYAAIQDWGYTLNPTYMPLQWLPFSLAEIIGIDYRWVPFSVLSVAICCYQYRLFKNNLNPFFLFLLSCLPWAIWWMVIDDEPKIHAYTIESLLAGYYLLLGLSLLTKKPMLIAMGITLCLLSRFSIVLWLPIFGIVMLFENRRDLLKIISYVAIATLLIYVFPFLVRDMEIFTNGMAHHTKAAVGEWQPYWQNIGDKPYHLFRGVGLAAFFYEWVDGDMLARIKVLQLWHVISIFICVISSGAFYFVYRTKIYVPVFLLACLKVYFCFFYYFIQIPYIYLMLVPLFTSILLVAIIFSNKNNQALSKV